MSLSLRKKKRRGPGRRPQSDWSAQSMASTVYRPPPPQEAVLENVGMGERAASAAESSSRRSWSQDSLRTELKQRGKNGDVVASYVSQAEKTRCQERCV